jgi:hypothetical protein
MKSIYQYNLRGCSAGFTDERDLWSTPLRWSQLTCTYTKFHEDRFRHSSNIKVTASTSWEVAWLVLLQGIYEVWWWGILGWHDIPTKIHDVRFRHSSNIKVTTSTIWEAAELVLLMGVIYKVCRQEGLRWHDIHTKLHKYRFIHSKVVREVIHTQRQRHTQTERWSHKTSFIFWK